MAFSVTLGLRSMAAVQHLGPFLHCSSKVDISHPHSVLVNFPSFCSVFNDRQRLHLNIGVVGGSATYCLCAYLGIFKFNRLLVEIPRLVWTWQRCQLSFGPHKYRNDKPVDTHSDSLMNVSPLHPSASVPSSHSPPFLCLFYAHYISERTSECRLR